MKRWRFWLLFALSGLMTSCGPGSEGSSAAKRFRQGGVEVDLPSGGFRAVAGQKIYVPVYSSILILDAPQSYDLAVTLSIRNTDQGSPIVITSAQYFDQDGKLVHDYLKKPLKVGPMAAVEMFVGERNTSGGVSASFLIDWLSEASVNPPVVESIMIGTSSNMGISFVSPGRVLSDRSKPSP